MLDQETLNLCNKVNAELQFERYNQRMIFIARIFKYDRFLGVDVKLLKRNRFYYVEQFDTLMEMDLEELEKFDQQLHLLCEQYGKAITRYGQE